MKGFGRAVTLTGFGSVATVGALFIETMIAVRFLNPEEFGGFAILVAVVNLCVAFADFGLKTSVIRFLAAGEDLDRPSTIHTVLRLKSLLVLSAGAIVYFLSFLLREIHWAAPMVQFAHYVVPMIFLAGLDESLLAVLQGLQNYRAMISSQILKSLLRLAITFTCLAVVGTGVVGLIVSWIFSLAGSLSYQLLALPRLGRWDWKTRKAKDLLAFGWPLYCNSCLVFLVQRLDVLLLGGFGGPAAVAAYDVATKIPTACQRLAESYTAVFYPTVSSAFGGAKQTDRAEAVLGWSLPIVSLASGAVALVAVLFGRDIVTAVFSSQYEGSHLAFSVLMIAFHVSVTLNLMGYTLVAAGHATKSLVEVTIRSVLNIGLNLFLIPILGSLGCAIARLIPTFVGNPVSFYLLRKTGLNVRTGFWMRQGALFGVALTISSAMQPLGPFGRGCVVAAFLLLSMVISNRPIRDFWLSQVDRGTTN